MKLFFDLDGTLIDSSERLYRLFKELVPQSELTKKEYWDIKREGINHKSLLEEFYPNVDYEQFSNKWLHEIESQRLIRLDTLYYDTIDVLNSLRDGSTIYLLTARQSETRLISELRDMEMLDFFTGVISSGQNQTKEEKLEAFCKDKGIDVQESDWIIGDMGKDILLGHRYGMNTIGIAHGFMSKGQLARYCPDYLVDTLSDIVEIIK